MFSAGVIAGILLTSTETDGTQQKKCKDGRSVEHVKYSLKSNNLSLV
jgi:hypothetical protein